MAVPVLTNEQRARALEKAIALRTLRAGVKAQLKAGEISLEHLLLVADSNDDLAGMKVHSVLESLPAFGKIKSQALMEQLDIAPTRRLRGLGEHQRKALLAYFAKRGAK